MSSKFLSWDPVGLVVLGKLSPICLQSVFLSHVSLSLLTPETSFLTLLVTQCVCVFFPHSKQVSATPAVLQLKKSILTQSSWRSLRAQSHQILPPTPTITSDAKCN